MKMDGKFYGNIRKVKDDSLVSDSDYVVFLVKDNAFALAMHDYRRHCIDLGADAAQINAVDRMIQRINIRRSELGSLCKVPDVAVGEKLLG